MFGSVFCETVCGYCVLGTAPERDQTTRETPRQTVELYRGTRGRCRYFKFSEHRANMQ